VSSARLSLSMPTCSAGSGQVGSDSRTTRRLEHNRAMLRRGAVLLAILAGGCAPVLTPQGHGVSVYLVKAGGVPRDSQMPEGCRLLGTKAPVNMSEAELAQEDPYRLARNDAGAAGGNALLVRSKMIASRRNVNCPVASPITDCPGNSGA